MVKRSTDQRLRLRNFDARHGKFESGAVIKSRKGVMGDEGGNTRPVFARRPLQFPPRSPRSCAKNRTHCATLSEPTVSRGRSTSRKRSARGRSRTCRVLRHPCRCYLKGTCTRTSCEYWHLPECQFYKNETGCKAGDKCLFPHYKVDEQPHEKPKRATSQTEEKANTRMLWLL